MFSFNFLLIEGVNSILKISSVKIIGFDHVKILNCQIISDSLLLKTKNIFNGIVEIRDCFLKSNTRIAEIEARVIILNNLIVS